MGAGGFKTVIIAIISIAIGVGFYWFWGQLYPEAEEITKYGVSAVGALASFVCLHFVGKSSG